MIAKNLSAGKSFDGLIDYAFEGREIDHKDKGAEVLRFSDDLLVPFSAQDKEGIRELKNEFNERTHQYLLENPENKNNLIGHQILSFTKQDAERLKPDGMNKALDDYIKLARLDETRFIAIKHNDTHHPHVHIIYHKVQNNMKKENDWKLNNKTVERGVALALKNNLTLVKDQKKVALTPGVLEIRAKDDDIKKMRNESDLLKSARNFHHFEKLLEYRSIPKEFLNDGRIRFEKKIYRPEDLHAVFHLNRIEKKNELAGVKERGGTIFEHKANGDTSDLNVKKEVKNILSSFIGSGNEKEPGTKGMNEQPFEFITIHSNDAELKDKQSMRRKRRGKSYLLKNRTDKQKIQTKNQEL